MTGNLFAAFCFAFVPCAALNTRSEKDVAGTVDRPVSRVVKLLEKMRADLEADLEADEEAYEKTKCWCKTNDMERGKSITDAEARIDDLFSTVKEAASKSGQLKAEIKGLQDQVADMQKSIAKSTEIREEEASSFTAEEKETMNTISALKKAIEAIQRQHAVIAKGMSNSSLIDTNNGVKKALSMLRLNMQSHGRVLLAHSKPHERRILKAFMQAPEGDEDDEFEALSQSNAPKQSLGLVGFAAPASSSILGILQKMLTKFEDSLSEAGQTEMKNRDEYEKMKTAKEQEIASCESRIANKQEELADYDETSAQANEDLTDTRGAHSADKEFLYDLHLHCEMADHEWSLRSKKWQEMITGVAKTIAALSNDNAKDTFTDAFHSEPKNMFQQQEAFPMDAFQDSEEQNAFPSKAIAFFQMRSLTGLYIDRKRAEAAKVLTAVARQTHSPVLLKIASRVSLDAFEKVKESIDNMISQLLKQGQDEVKRKEFCNQAFQDNDMETMTNVRDKRVEDAKLVDVKSRIEGFKSEIEILKTEIAELEAVKKKASDFREIEKNFHRIITNQQKAQKVLHKALDLLKGKAAGHSEAFGVGFLQQPEGFGAQEQHEGHASVIAILEHLIKNSKALEDATKNAEQEEKEEYRKMVVETQASIDEKTTGMMNKSEDLAKAEEELAALEQYISEIAADIERLGFEKGDLHESCDFILKNFDIRQEARAQEVDALRKANAILSGSNFQSFLQGK